MATDAQPTETAQSAKQRMIAILQDQPEDSSFDELLRELALAKMINRGIEDYRAGRVLTHEEVGERIKKWQS